MPSVLKRFSQVEYLAQERLAEFKSEYLQGEVFAMAGGTSLHSQIAANFIRDAGVRLTDRPCEVYTSDLRIRIDAVDLYTYPDASIICGDPETNDEIRDNVLNPTVVVEVLSDSTEKYDRGKKAGFYRQIPSLKELILIAQDRYSVEQFVRQSSGSWLLKEFNDLDQALTIDSIDISIPLREIYRNVKFEGYRAGDRYL